MGNTQSGLLSESNYPSLQVPTHHKGKSRATSPCHSLSVQVSWKFGANYIYRALSRHGRPWGIQVKGSCPLIQPMSRATSPCRTLLSGGLPLFMPIPRNRDPLIHISTWEPIALILSGSRILYYAILNLISLKGGNLRYAHFGYYPLWVPLNGVGSVELF